MEKDAGDIRIVSVFGREIKGGRGISAFAAEKDGSCEKQRLGKTAAGKDSG